MRDLLQANQVDPTAMQTMQAFHADVVKKVQETVRSNKIVVVGMSQNPVVRKARRLLDEKNLKFAYLEYGSYLSQWKPRLAIKLWSGWPTFPQVFVDGKLIGGCREMEAWLAAGKLS